MVCLARLRGMVYFLWKKKSLSCIHTQQSSTFDFSFNDLTYMLCAPQISLRLKGGNRDGHWGNLQFVLWRIPRRKGRETGREGGKIYLRKSAGSKKGRHGKILIFHARKHHYAPQKKQTLKKQDWTQGTRVTWNRWNSERGKEYSYGISGLFSLILTRVV